MAIDEAKTEYKAADGRVADPPFRHSPEAFPGECGSLPVEWQIVKRAVHSAIG